MEADKEQYLEFAHTFKQSLVDLFQNNGGIGNRYNKGSLGKSASGNELLPVLYNGDYGEQIYELHVDKGQIVHKLIAHAPSKFNDEWRINLWERKKGAKGFPRLLESTHPAEMLRFTMENLDLFRNSLTLLPLRIETMQSASNDLTKAIERGKFQRIEWEYGGDY